MFSVIWLVFDLHTMFPSSDLTCTHFQDSLSVLQSSIDRSSKVKKTLAVVETISGFYRAFWLLLMVSEFILLILKRFEEPNAPFGTVDPPNLDYWALVNMSSRFLFSVVSF